MSKLIRAIYDYNICTYYLLPLIKLNKFSFGENNFLQCYVSRDGSKLYIELREIPAFVYSKVEYLGTAILPNGNVAVVMGLHPLWEPDFRNFIDGKYSKLSKPAKDAVLAYSGLPFNQHTSNNVPYTDSRILAINPDPGEREKLRRALMSELGVNIPVDQELISIPTELNYVDDTVVTKTLFEGETSGV